MKSVESCVYLFVLSKRHLKERLLYKKSTFKYFWWKLAHLGIVKTMSFACFSAEVDHKAVSFCM